MKDGTSPPIYKKSSEDIFNFLCRELEQTTWQRNAGDLQPGTGQAMSLLFARLAEIFVTRLNQIPENHFLAFLDEAGIDLLPPRPAKTDITFFPGKDAPEVIHIPSGTQLSAKKSESRPEVIFETERDCTVVRTELSACIVADPVRVSDRTSRARGEIAGSFDVFRGEEERERILYIENRLFDFPDPETRKNCIITLSFTFSPPGKPDIDGWRLEWRYFDGSVWKNLPERGESGAEVVIDDTGNFSRDGKVAFRNLPDLIFDEKSGARIACRLTGGTGRAHLPVIKRLTGEREVTSNAVEKPVEALFSAIHSGTAFIPLDPGGEFFPLGQRPERLDAFYIKADDVFFAGEANVEINVDMEGFPSSTNSKQLDNLEIEWAYSSEGGWNSVGKCNRNGEKEGSGHGFADTTNAFTVTSGDSTTSTTVRFKLARNKPRKSTKIGGKEGFWLRARVTAGGYGLDIEPTTIWKAPDVYPPYIKNIRITYSGYPDNSIAEESVDMLSGSVDGRASNHVFSADPQELFSPFAGALDIAALYLGFSNPFPPGEWIRLLLDVDEGRSADDTGTKILWEYWDRRSENWDYLSVSDLSEGLNRRGYVGFYGPEGHGGNVLFSKEACWLRVRPHVDPPVAATSGEKTVDCGTGDSATVILDASLSTATDNLNISRYIWSRVPPVADAGTDPEAIVYGVEGPVTLDASRSTDGAGGKLSNARYIWRKLSFNNLAARAQVNIPADGQEATVVLNASGSFTADGSPVHTYRWEKISSGTGAQGASDPVSGAPSARAEISVLTGNGEAAITLDASGSFSTGDRPIARYIWREKIIVENDRDQAAGNPFLNAVRCNTVQSANAFSVTEETLGSGNGKPGQSFSCLRRPVLPNIRIYVREPDEPSQAEMNTLQQAMSDSDDDGSQASPAILASDDGTWVLWQRVDHFFFSNATSRHFVLDQADGRIRFGDGIRGRIPPIGRDNIKAAFYRSHQGSAANVAANEITVLRNPAGGLVSIKRVTNPDACAGGSDTETIEEVRQRGPKALKHRGKSITTEDFAWLAREASGEIAAAWCLPTRDARGKTREGWVTVVILPENREPRPFPLPALLRLVRQYLEAHALVNLGKEGQIFVKGPEYLEARAHARIVPLLADKSDEVKLAVMSRLDEFFHPISGGPEKTGWKLGRDVYLSEVYAEIEAVDGVDHVAGLSLSCSQQQPTLCLAMEKPLSHGLPAGAMVGTFDEQIRYVLAGRLDPEGSDNAQRPEISPGPALTLQVCAFGFKTGDRVNVIDSAGDITINSVLITAISAEGGAITLDMPISVTGGFLADFPPALLSADEKIRLPVIGWDEDGDGRTVARIKSFEADKDMVCIVFDGQRFSELQFLPVISVSTRHDRIVVPEGHLVCSGAHSVEMISGE